MSGQLDEIRAKLDRAEEHLDALDERIPEWLSAEKPHGFSRHEDEGQRLYVFSFHELKPFPPWVAIIAGETVHQMRSALDHLVARTIEHQGGQVTTASGFPVIHTQRQWETRVAQRGKWWQLWRKEGGPLKGIDPASHAWALIQDAQPYHRGKQAGSHPLYVLNDLWNRDKHRSANYVWMATTRQAILDMFTIEPPVEPIERVALLPKDGTLINGAAIARFRFPADKPLPEMKVEHPLTRKVRTGKRGVKGDGRSIGLRDCLTFVRDIAQKFDELV